ncbi:MAG TPA: MFS transporter [Acidobacteriota bacterium]|nr:MFS transporter [Acidobacteriota bacterium]HNT18341.1 MFS transporter [Acidobacteriota bacterium]
MSEEIKEIKNPLKEIVQPFIDLVHAPRALWGINLPYLLEGMCYFGILGYLAIYFSDIVFKGIAHNDVWSHRMVMVLTAGITISMFFLGFVADKFGIRRALLFAFILLLAGRVLISSGSFLGLDPGLWGGLHLITLAGMLLVVIGYGMYQPAAYAGVREVTNEKTAPMAFAMLYALMNLGGYIPTYAFLVRDKDYLGWGIPGAFWVYTFFTLIALTASFLILSNKTYKEAVENARAEKGMKPASEDKPKEKKSVMDWLKNHPLTDLKFAFFIFALIPVQTLFTYNWLILPQYISRCYEGWIGEKFEIASNFNPILIFIFVPIITAITYKRKVYNMMIIGTLVMALPAFFLAFGTNFWTLFSYLIIMTIGEAMWQPRFLQFAAQIAPEGRTGEYMGVAQLPWFLTKVLVPAIYSGFMIEKYCPAEGMKDPQTMWFWFGIIAIASPILLLIAKPWAGKDFKAHAD